GALPGEARRTRPYRARRPLAVPPASASPAPAARGATPNTRHEHPTGVPVLVGHPHPLIEIGVAGEGCSRVDRDEDAKRAPRTFTHVAAPDCLTGHRDRERGLGAAGHSLELGERTHDFLPRLIEPGLQVFHLGVPLSEPQLEARRSLLER